MESAFRIVVIGGSGQGSLDALCELLTAWPMTVPVLVVVALSNQPEPIQAVQERVAGSTHLDVLLAQHGQVTQPDHVYLGLPGHHLLLEAEGRLSLLSDEQVLNRRPAADLLFISAVSAYNTRVIGVVLSGSGSSEDGVAGSRAIKRAGGITLAQHPASASNPGMPLQTIAHDSPHFIATPGEIGLLLGYLISSNPDPKLFG